MHSQLRLQDQIGGAMGQERTRGELLTLKQAAEELGVSARTVRRWVSFGRLRAVRLSRKSLRIHARDLDRFIEGCRGAGGQSGAEDSAAAKAS